MNQVLLARLLERPPGEFVARALDQLFSRDGILLELDANERSIAYRLAMYLQAELPTLNVDCEYNRDGIDPKKIQHLYLVPNDEDTEAKTVFPDIIAHVRNSENNYLVVELKKTTNTVSRDTDIAKLRGYKNALGYEFALFIELIAAANPDVKTIQWVDV